ncbi:MAG: flagellar basal body P-ring protein FlgI [Pseudomonadota bacterium]
MLVVLMLLAEPASAMRIKDMADLKGVRANQLVGYGLVIGLDGTGDGSAEMTVQTMSNMLDKMGVTVKPGDIAADNVASVMVTTDLPPFVGVGSRLDVLVSAIGGAKNLQGGTLIYTPLKGGDGNIYVIAQGPVSTGGFQATGKSGGGIQKNFPTVGRVVNGGTVEQSVRTSFAQDHIMTFSLNRADFTTAARVAAAINAALLGSYANTPDGGTVNVVIPGPYRDNPVSLVTLIENVEVSPDNAARVVINERTGTVVMGADVRISTIAIAHGNLSIQIRETKDVNQPLPFSQGQTVVSPESNVAVSEERSPIFLVESGVSIGDVVRALNTLGVSPRDLIAIFQAIKQAGALQARLEIM